MSLDKWFEFVKPEIKPPYVNREKYLDNVTKIEFKRKRKIFYINVFCRNLKKNIHKENICSIKYIVNPICINCEYVREVSKVRTQFRKLKQKSFTYFYDYEVIEI